MPQPWVKPDFDDCEIVSSSIPNTSKRNAVGGTKRPLSSLSQETAEKYSYTRSSNQEALWSLRYAPKSSSDLIVAKPKVSELTDVLANASEPRIVLLIGPPGCGKSITVRCIAKSLGLRVREWNQPSSEARSFLDSRGDIGDHYDSGVCRSFSDFILNATCYESLCASSSGSSPGVITVVEDMPMFKSELCPVTLFHEMLRQCASCLRHPVCFVLTSNAASADPPDLHRLFPQRLRDELRIYTLSLNPIPTRTMTKFLTTIVTAEKVAQVLPSNCIAEVVETSEGDLRSAINSLQFLSQKIKLRQADLLSSSSKRGPKERRLAPSTKSSSTSKQTSTAKDTNAFNLNNFLQSESDKGSSDSHSLLLFRALGRVLYCKRMPPIETGDLKAVVPPNSRVSLPPHLQQFDADSLTFDPVALLRHCPISMSTFVGFLEHNVPSFYTSIDDLANLSERYLSICDLLLNQWNSTFESNSDLAGLLAIFAVVNCNSARRRFHEKDQEDNHQSQATGHFSKSGAGHSSFKPLHAPPFWNTYRGAHERQKLARSLLPDYLYTSSDQVIADYASFARTTRNFSSYFTGKGWLRELGSLGDVSRMAIRSATLSASATNFDEDSVGENLFPHQNVLPSSQQKVGDRNMSTDEAAEYRSYNDAFLQTIEEEDDF